MSRSMREARMKALLGEKRYGDRIVTELGGRKRDRKKMLLDEMEESYRKGTLPEYQEGSVPAWARSPIIESSRQGAPSMAHRKVMNALPTLAGLGVALSRGASFGPGPDDSIVAQYDDPSGLVDPSTLGEVMLLPEKYGTQSGTSVPTHELGHVAQGRYFGPLLPAAAAATSGILALQGRDPYMESPFETSAIEMGQAEKSGGSTARPMWQAMKRALGLDE